jgi:hypothetical protein
MNSNKRTVKLTCIEDMNVPSQCSKKSRENKFAQNFQQDCQKNLTSKHLVMLEHNL